MEVRSLSVHDVKLYRVTVKGDDRGYFLKPFSSRLLEEIDIDFRIEEVFYSMSVKNTIRGMHFQYAPYEQAKLVSVIKGRITDVVLDIRTNSETYGKYVSLELSEGDGQVIYIPKGMAHGFVSRAYESLVLYMADNQYAPDYEGGIRYDSFGFDWKVSYPVVSERDLSFIRFDEFES